ncbi:MAG: hypothetical protein C0483_18245 [Pirellula sp.]|nr:hypothetical protein [Pirellula sp.]
MVDDFSRGQNTHWSARLNNLSISSRIVPLLIVSVVKRNLREIAAGGITMSQARGNFAPGMKMAFEAA